MADERKIKLDIIDKAEVIAEALSNGKDAWITKNKDGVVVKILTVQKVRENGKF